MQENRQVVRRLVEMALFIAIAVVIDLLAGIYSPFPYGGSISFAMLPIIFIAYRYGAKHGLMSGFIFGVVQSLVAMAIGQFWFLSVTQYFLDYILAFVVLGSVGFFRNALTNSKIYLFGILLAGILRYLVHSFSGVVFWGQYAPEGMNVWFYSFVAYNLPYMGASIVVSLIVGYLLFQRKLFEIYDKSEEIDE